MELNYIHLCSGLFQDALKCLKLVYSVRKSNIINAAIFKLP